MSAAFCSQCGTPLTDNPLSRYCSGCGAQLVPSESTVDSAQVGLVRGLLRRGRDTIVVGFAGFAASGCLVISALSVVLFAGLLYWISDLAYEIHWLVGFPIRLIAFAAAVGAAFTVIALVFQLLFLLGGIVVGVWRAMLGRGHDL